MVNSRGNQNEHPPHCTGVPRYNVPCLPGQTGYIVPGHPGYNVPALPPRRPIRGQQIYDSQSQSAMGGSAGTLYPGCPGTMYPHCPGQTGYIVPGHPGTMRGVLVLIAPTVSACVNHRAGSQQFLNCLGNILIFFFLSFWL